MSNMISNYSSISAFSFWKWIRTLCNRLCWWNSVLILLKLPRTPDNEGMARNAVFYIYFCKLLCLTYSWEEKWHCFLYLKLFKKWVETPINLGCVVTWAYFLLWGSVDSNEPSDILYFSSAELYNWIVGGFWWVSWACWLMSEMNFLFLI